MPYIHKMYSDESGYTGDDLLHPTQPFFVYSFGKQRIKGLPQEQLACRNGRLLRNPELQRDLT